MDKDDFSKNMILIVDDIPENLNVLIMHLHQMGFTTSVASGGKEALEIIAFTRPDIILLDVIMPEMDGFEVCRRLKENDETKDIPVIFVTALSDTVDKVKGFEVGGVDYITKPYYPDEVIARVKTHLTIQNLQRELRELNANKDKFFSIIADDLNNPSSTLLLAAEVLTNASAMDPKDIENAAKRLKNSTESLLRILENLRIWSQVRTKKIKFKPEHLRLKRIVDANISLLQLNFSNKNISVVTHIAHEIHVYADLNMMIIILQNLLSNAYKFTSNGGRVGISAVESDRMVEISIDDNGMGIQPENIHKLFKIDQKYKTKGTLGEEGTGLGLILCQELVEKHGGQIWVESDVGDGSTFKFTIPQGDRKQKIT